MIRSAISLATNSGAGEARNFRINSAAPRIIENEKGLSIEFQLLGARVNNEPLNPSFNLKVGSIAPGTSKTVIWDMTSTLQGKLIDYRATFEHMDALGGLSLSLIDAVRIHEMIHVVRSVRAGDDTLPDFLLNDSPDPDNLPDVVYLSDSTTGAVAIANGGTGLTTGPSAAGQFLRSSGASTWAVSSLQH